MTARTGAEREAARKARLAEKGLIRVEVYVRPEDEPAVRQYDARGREAEKEAEE